MNLLVENAHLAWLAGLIALPPLVHLFARTRPPRFLFAATQFVLKAVRKTMRLRRPKDWLLLLCRTLLVAALVGAFVRPVLFLNGVPEDGGSARTVVVIVDRSASMAWTEGGQSRFAAACAGASELFGGLSSRDSADLVWLDAEPEAVFPEPGPNAAYLRQRLAQAHVSSESGDPAAAIELALSLFEGSAGTRELCILSDFQASQWSAVKLKLPEHVRLYTLKFGEADASNGAVLAVRAEPPAPVAGEAAQVVCEIANFSAEARTRVATIEIGEARVARPVMLPPWGRGVVSVDHVFRKAGQHVIQARIDEDGFGSDDWRGAIVPARDALRVAVCGDDPRTAPIWTRALRAIPWTSPVPLGYDDLALADACDLLLLAGWDGGTGAAPLKALRSSGMPVVVSPAPNLNLRQLAMLGGPPGGASVVAWEPLREPAGMTTGDPGHPVFALFRTGDFGDPARGSFRARWRLPESELSGRTLLRFADGAPAIHLFEANPPLLLWAAPLSHADSDWASQTAFLPWFGELVGSLRARRAGATPPTMMPGERLAWCAAAGEFEVRLDAGAGGTIATTAASAGAEGWRHVSDPVAVPGVYRWFTGQECRATQVVNFPTVESDLRSGTPPAATDGTSSTIATAVDLDTARKGTPLWTFFAWLCLAVLLVESGVVLLCERERRVLAGDAS